MPAPHFISQNSRFFDNLLEHRFLFDLRRHLVLRKKPLLLNVLQSEVDAFGFDLVLSVGEHTYHIQMKTRSGAPPATSYDLAESLWRLPNACAIWMLYDASTIEPTGYYLLGNPLPPMDGFVASKQAEYRGSATRGRSDQSARCGARQAQ
jgi:hypothetical protein